MEAPGRKLGNSETRRARAGVARGRATQRSERPGEAGVPTDRLFRGRKENSPLFLKPYYYFFNTNESSASHSLNNSEHAEAGIAQRREVAAATTDPTAWVFGGGGSPALSVAIYSCWAPEKRRHPWGGSPHGAVLDHRNPAKPLRG